MPKSEKVFRIFGGSSPEGDNIIEEPKKIATPEEIVVHKNYMQSLVDAEGKISEEELKNFYAGGELEEKYGLGQVSPDENGLRKREADIATNRIQRRSLGSVERATDQQLEANNERVFGIMNALWGSEGKIRIYENSFDTPNKLKENLEEIENYLVALDGLKESQMEFEGKTVFETIKRLVKIRDHIKLIMLEK